MTWAMASDAVSLVNQEDDPIPIDQATVGTVEAQEHFEATSAALVDGDGCGVQRRRKTRIG